MNDNGDFRLDVSAQVLRDRACGAMLGLSIGDALGATVEFMTPREIQAQYGVHDRIRGGGWLRLKPGGVTDDTTMTLALADAWLEHAGGARGDGQDIEIPDAETCARAFDTWMRGKPVDIGHTVRRGIVRWRLSGSAITVPSDDAGNGATMRCLPVALALFGGAPDSIVSATLAQARVTHNNPLTDAATLCVIDMVQIALRGGGQAALMERARQLAIEHPLFEFHGRRVDNPSAYIVDTMRVVFQGMAAFPAFEGAIIDIVNRGGDADTTAAIAGMMLGALAGQAALPRRWLDALDAAPRAACIAAATRLIERSPGWAQIERQRLIKA
ncbi:MAG: ADP-ribosylglycohydrolase family protein [Azoarcus sp.]|nr:ADP-ribosylglycohydrolase family protein [Azoarcus sp.]